MDRYLIDGHKLFWHLDRVCQWQNDRTVVPIYMEVSPVAYCNHRCVFCGIDFAQARAVRLEAESFLERLREMGELGVRSIMFAGEGEPLLHPDLALFVRTGREAGIDISITTNGSLGHRALWESVLPHLTWMRFSVDAGTPEVYATVHGVSEREFGKTLQSVRDAVAVKRDLRLGLAIGVQFLLINQNVGDLRAMLELFTGIGVDYISIKPYSLHPQMIEKMDVSYSSDLIQKVEATLVSFRNRSETTISFRKTAFQAYLEKEKRYHRCRALPFWGYICADGDFYTCSVFIGDSRFRAGNIYRENMKALLFGEARRQSIHYGEQELSIENECRCNCRMARINEFLEFLDAKPQHVNFI